MIRKFLSLDGEIVAEEEWKLQPTDRCFYCNRPLIAASTHPCTFFGGVHDFITLINPTSAT
jgi:hypothetical protein